MGFIRGGLLVVASIILFLSFLVGNVFLTLNLSLDYETIKPELVSVVKDISENEINVSGMIGENFEFMELYCENNSEFVSKYEEVDYTLVLPCDVVSQGSEAVIEYATESLVEEFYYKDYDCEFLDCLKETKTPFFLVSEQAKNYWGSKFYFLISISFVLIGFMFFLIERKINLPIIAGSLLTISALPFMKFDSFLSLASDNSFFQFFIVFFTKAHTVFLISFISGLVILGTGIGLKLWRVGTGKDKKFSKNEVKKIVKKEISESKEKKSK